MGWLWDTLQHLDVATWLRMVGYTAIFMMCLFVAMEWQRGLHLMALAGMYYCLVRIVTTALNALRIEQARGLLDVLTVSAVWVCAFALAITIYYWQQQSPHAERDA